MLTLFSIPKAFEGHNGVIQRNALRSWAALGGQVEILLLGNDPGVEQTAAQFDVAHLGDLAVSDYGTPRLDSAFDLAVRHARYDCICYINADIMIPENFLETVAAIIDRFVQFLAVGRRWNVNVEADIEEISALRSHVERLRQESGKLHPPTGMDFFLFPKGELLNLPPFVVGRPVWDNWMIFSAKKNRIPIIDVTQCCQIIHQNHDYKHVPNATNVWEGPEADFNRTLAFAQGTFNARKYTTVSADWIIDDHMKIRRKPLRERLRRMMAS